jgi:hypothetical protein
VKPTQGLENRVQERLKNSIRQFQLRSLGLGCPEDAIPSHFTPFSLPLENAFREKLDSCPYKKSDTFLLTFDKTRV